MIEAVTFEVMASVACQFAGCSVWKALSCVGIARFSHLLAVSAQIFFLVATVTVLYIVNGAWDTMMKTSIFSLSSLCAPV